MPNSQVFQAQMAETMMDADEHVGVARPVRVGGAPVWLVIPLAVLLVGALCVLLAGWGTGIEIFTRFSPGWSAMVPSTALGFVLLAIGALFWVRAPREPLSERVVQGIALAAGGLGLVNGAVMASGVAPGIDALIYPHFDLFQTERMSQATTLCLVLTAVALFCLPGPVGKDALFVITGSAALFISLLALVTYAFDAQALYNMSVFSTMAVHTAGGFVLAAGSILLCRMDRGWVALLAQKGQGSLRARRTLPLLLLAPLVLTLAAFWGVDTGLFDVNFAFSLLAVSMMGLMAFLVFHEAEVGNVADDELKEAVQRETWAKANEAALRANHERFRTLAQALPIGVYQTDGSGRMNFVNSAFCEIFGLSESRFLGQEWMKSLQDVEPFRGEDAWEGFRRPGDRKDYEFDLTTQDGRFLYMRSVKTAVFNAEGQVSGFVGAVVDVTSHREALQNLRINEQRFQTLANMAPVGIFRTDMKDRCNYVNEAWLEMAGVEREEALGPGWGYPLHPDDNDRVLEEWLHATTTGEPFHSRYRFLHADGSERAVLGMAAPERDARGEIIGYIGICLEVREFIATAARGSAT